MEWSYGGPGHTLYGKWKWTVADWRGRRLSSVWLTEEFSTVKPLPFVLFEMNLPILNSTKYHTTATHQPHASTLGYRHVLFNWAQLKMIRSEFSIHIETISWTSCVMQCNCPIRANNNNKNRQTFGSYFPLHRAIRLASNNKSVFLIIHLWLKKVSLKRAPTVPNERPNIEW